MQCWNFCSLAVDQNLTAKKDPWMKGGKSIQEDLGPGYCLTSDIHVMLRTSLAFRLDFLLDNEKMGLDRLWGPSHYSSSSWSKPKAKSLSTPTFYGSTRYFMTRRTKWNLSGRRWSQHRLGWPSPPPHILLLPVGSPSISALNQLNRRWWSHQGLLPAVKDALVPVMAHLPQTVSSIWTFMGPWIKGCPGRWQVCWEGPGISVKW